MIRRSLSICHCVLKSRIRLTQGSAMTGSFFPHSLYKNRAIRSHGVSTLSSMSKCPFPETPKQLFNTLAPGKLLSHRLACVSSVSSVAQGNFGLFSKENRLELISLTMCQSGIEYAMPRLSAHSAISWEGPQLSMASQKGNS